MKMHISLAGKDYQADMTKAMSVTIELSFNGPQPNHFSSHMATATPFAAGGFIGDTKQGGSCNVADIRFVPHCNGTHTESCGHITDEAVAVGEIAPKGLLSAVLISVSPLVASDCRDEYIPKAEADDQLITRALLAEALDDYDDELLQAVLVRTLPNNSSKLSYRYGEDGFPAFFSLDAIRYLNERGVEHLLTDLPSVDKMYDQGLLSNHHEFWHIAHGSHVLSENAKVNKTITELIYAPDEISDGLYLLNLQVPAFASDAAPSRPILYPLQEK
jgi:arylformamidase